jgi:hypothetical protein
MTIERPSKELKVLLEQQDYVMGCTISSFGETLWLYRPTKEQLNTNFLIFVFKI